MTVTGAFMVMALAFLCVALPLTLYTAFKGVK